MKSIYSLLNNETKNWWYFKDLRKNGKCDLARQKERASILSDIKFLRQVIKHKGYLHLGNAQWGIYIDKPNKGRESLSGYYDLGRYTYMEEICKRLGILIIDTRKIDPLDAMSMPVRDSWEGQTQKQWLARIQTWSKNKKLDLIIANLPDKY
jgi:hypothetical protein